MTDKYRYFEENIGSGEYIYNRWNVKTERMQVRMLPPNDTGWQPDLLALTPEDLVEGGPGHQVIEITESVFNFKLKEAHDDVRGRLELLWQWQPGRRQHLRRRRGPLPW